MENKNNILTLEIKNEEVARAENGQPSGGYANIGNYVRNITPEQRSENAKMGQKKAAENRRNMADARKAFQLWASAKLPATREKARKELEELGLPTDQLQAAFQGVGNSAVDFGNPKALETLLKAGGQWVEKSSVSIADMQMDKDELLARFGMLESEDKQ